MAKVLVTYFSRTGHTEKMAEIIAETVRARGHEVTLKRVADTTLEDLREADGVLVGSPTYYGQMAGEVKSLFDRSVKYHGKLDGKVGGAFTSSGLIGGGNETTVMGILACLLVHGFIVQGNPSGDHYGPVSIGKPDERAEKGCQRYGERFADLLDRMRV